MSKWTVIAMTAFSLTLASVSASADSRCGETFENHRHFVYTCESPQVRGGVCVRLILQDVGRRLINVWSPIGDKAGSFEYIFGEETNSKSPSGCLLPLAENCFFTKMTESGSEVKASFRAVGRADRSGIFGSFRVNNSFRFEVEHRRGQGRVSVNASSKGWTPYPSEKREIVLKNCVEN